MTTINVVTVTKDQDFPVGTVDSSFVFNLVGTDGGTVDSFTSEDGTASFTNVTPGTYTVTGTKNGATVTSDPIVVAQPTVSLKVPASITVTLS